MCLLGRIGIHARTFYAVSAELQVKTVNCSKVESTAECIMVHTYRCILSADSITNNPGGAKFPCCKCINQKSSIVTDDVTN